MVDGTEQALAFARQRMRPFSPFYVSRKHVEAYPITSAEFAADGSGKVLVEGNRSFLVPAGFASRSVPSEGDMLVRYAPTAEHPEGYLSHSPRKVFDDGYSPMPTEPEPAEHHKSFEGGGRGLSFGQAIEQLKAGDRVARDGWNGRGMWLSLSGPMPGRAISAENFWSSNNSEYARQNGGSATVLPCITMKVATGEILMGWLASQSDMLAEDWCVV